MAGDLKTQISQIPYSRLNPVDTTKSLLYLRVNISNTAKFSVAEKNPKPKTLRKRLRVDSVISVYSFRIPFYGINCHGFKSFSYSSDYKCLLDQILVIFSFVDFYFK